MIHRIFHRFSRWAYVLIEMEDGFPPYFDRTTQFRMCATCGHQEIRERVRT